jgi:hypothetical protein
MVQWISSGILNDSALFFVFCDYLPFEEDLTLFLKKILEFASPGNNLY